MRQRLEIVAISLGRLIVPRFSRSGVWRLGHVLGCLAYRFDGRGRRIAEANLDLVYGERLSAERRRLLSMVAYRHAARVLLDIFWFSRDNESRLREWCELEADFAENLRRAPGLVVSGHLGNWELAGQVLSAWGIGLTSVAKPIGGEATSQALNRVRAVTGQEIVAARGAVRPLLRALREGRAVALVIDQHTDPEEGGVFVDFLGLPASVSGVVGTLSRRFQIPVYVGYCLRDARGRYRCIGQPQSLPPQAERTPEAVTAHVTQILTSVIRRHPGQWLWMYKRWKRAPEGWTGRSYPFYAKTAPVATTPLASEDCPR